MPMLRTIDRPTKATLRPWACAASSTCWMRCTWLAKLETMMRRWAVAKTWSMAGARSRSEVVQPVPDRGEVRQDHVDPRLVVLREEDPAVDHEQLALVLEDRHVAADLAQPAQRGHAQDAAREAGRGLQVLGLGWVHEVNPP